MGVIESTVLVLFAKRSLTLFDPPSLSSNAVHFRYEQTVVAKKVSVLFCHTAFSQYPIGATIPVNAEFHVPCISTKP